MNHFHCDLEAWQTRSLQIVIVRVPEMIHQNCSTFKITAAKFEVTLGWINNIFIVRWTIPSVKFTAKSLLKSFLDLDLPQRVHKAQKGPH